jgi:hypothetical protein
LHIFILTTGQELWARELMCRIMSCDHSLCLKEILDQLNLLYTWIGLHFAIDKELWVRKLMNRIMGCDHSLSWKEVLKFVYCFMILFRIAYIF